MKAARKLQRLQEPQSLIEFVRRFLTPQVWKQSRQAVPLVSDLVLVGWRGEEQHFHDLWRTSVERGRKTLLRRLLVVDVISPFHSLTAILANKRRKVVRTPVYINE